MDQGIADVGDARAELENTASAFHAANLGPIRKSWRSPTPMYGRLPPLHRSWHPGGQIEHPGAADGVVALLVAEPGQAIIPGQPVMTLQARGPAWTSFNLREDQLDDLTIGFPVELMPAGASIRFVSDCMQVV